MKTGSKELIRDINSRLVLEAILTHAPISRASIAKHLGLTKATISAIVAQLLQKDLLIELESDDTSLGRKPVLLSLNKRAGYALCINLGVETISAIVTNLAAEIISFKQIQTPSKPQKLLDSILELINTILVKLPTSTYGPIGIAIGIQGITSKNKILSSRGYDLSSLDLAGSLEAQFGIPVYLEKEASLAVLSDRTFSYDEPNIASICLQTGMSVGLLLNNQLYTGSFGSAGEFGTSSFEATNTPTSHGLREVSEYNLLQQFALRKQLSSCPMNTFTSFYQKKDLDALELTDEFILSLSLGIKAVATAYSPGLVVLHSSLLDSNPELIGSLYKRLGSSLPQTMQIIPAVNQSSSILFGGIAMCLKEFLNLSQIHRKITDLSDHFTK